MEVHPYPADRPVHTAYTYAQGPVNSDPYYQENIVFSDLPAGIYKLLIHYKDKDIQGFAEIYPGQVTNFRFTDKNGFQIIPPPPPQLGFLPGTATVSPTPKPKP
jgi:hypothetical protein